MSKKVSALLALLLLFSNQGSATVVVVIVTPRAIVMGADGRGVSGTPNSLLGGTGTPSVEDKIVLLNGSVLVANVGVSRMTTTDGHLLYHFNRWVVTLAKQTGRTAPTVSMIAQRIRESSFKVFDKELSSTLKAGTFTSLNLARDPSLPMVTYFIAGYEGHKARIFKVFIEVDWKKRILKKPVIESIYPPPGNVTRKNLLFASNGSSKRGIDSLLTKDSPIQKAYLAMYPKEIGALVYDTPLECAELVKLARITLTLEISASPEIFGFPITIFALPDCNPSHYSYDN